MSSTRILLEIIDMKHDRQPHGEHAHAHAELDGAEKRAATAHDKRAGHTVATFRNKFALTLLLTVPTVIWSEMIQHWFDYTAPRFAGSAYLPAIFGTSCVLLRRLAVSTRWIP